MVISKTAPAKKHGGLTRNNALSNSGKSLIHDTKVA